MEILPHVSATVKKVREKSQYGDRETERQDQEPWADGHAQTAISASEPKLSACAQNVTGTTRLLGPVTGLHKFHGSEITKGMFSNNEINEMRTKTYEYEHRHN